MNQSLLPMDPAKAALLMFGVHFTRYLLVAGLAFLGWYVWKRPGLLARKIQSRWPKSTDYQREILFSAFTALVFAGVTLLMQWPPVRVHTHLYHQWSDYGTAYGIASFFGLVLLHDTYFYWTHRAMHHPKLFKTMHLLHHKSTNPSPWAAYAFHPLEAVVEAGIVPLALFIMPLHIFTLLAFLFFMISYNVYGHLGWELFPAGTNRHWLGRWFNTSVNHNQHHQYFRGNYGLYFQWWDRWLGTTRPDYEAAFDKATAKPVTQSVATEVG